MQVFAEVNQSVSQNVHASGPQGNRPPILPPMSIWISQQKKKVKEMKKVQEVDDDSDVEIIDGFPRVGSVCPAPPSSLVVSNNDKNDNEKNEDETDDETDDDEPAESRSIISSPVYIPQSSSYTPSYSQSPVFTPPRSNSVMNYSVNTPNSPTIVTPNVPSWRQEYGAYLQKLRRRCKRRRLCFDNVN
jgi:hypothetical protein